MGFITWQHNRVHWYIFINSLTRSNMINLVTLMKLLYRWNCNSTFKILLTLRSLIPSATACLISEQIVLQIGCFQVFELFMVYQLVSTLKLNLYIYFLTPIIILPSYRALYNKTKTESEFINKFKLQKHYVHHSIPWW